MTFQRRHRGELVRILTRTKQTDEDGNIQYVPTNIQVSVKAWVEAIRSTDTAVPGQVQISQYRVGVLFSDVKDADFGLWTMVQMRGKTYDIVTPVQIRPSAWRHNEHVIFDVRERP